MTNEFQVGKVGGYTARIENGRANGEEISGHTDRCGANPPEEVAQQRKAAARKLKRAQMLLAANAGHMDEDIAANVQIHVNRIERLRRWFVEGGVEHALTENKRPGGKSKLDGKAEAIRVALARSDPPTGQSQWTMQLLADRLVEMGVVETIPDEPVRLRLKKRLETMAAGAVVHSEGRLGGRGTNGSHS